MHLPLILITQFPPSIHPHSSIHLFRAARSHRFRDLPKLVNTSLSPSLFLTDLSSRINSFLIPSSINLLHRARPISQSPHSSPYYIHTINTSPNVTRFRKLLVERVETIQYNTSLSFIINLSVGKHRRHFVFELPPRQAARKQLHP